MKFKSNVRKSKNVIDRRNQRVGPEIVGLAKRNAEAAQWMKDNSNVPEKVKSDLNNALTYTRRKNAVKQTRDNLPLRQAAAIIKKRANPQSQKKGRVK